jgi:hypothetical protein
MNIDFLKAKAEIQARVASLERELKEAHEELTAFERVELIVQRRAGKTAEASTFKLVSQPQTAQKNGHQRRAGFPLPTTRGLLTQQILHSVLVADKPLTASNVKTELLKQGLVPTGKHFGLTVMKTLNRLSERGLIKRTKTEEDRVLYTKAA